MASSPLRTLRNDDYKLKAEDAEARIETCLAGHGGLKGALQAAIEAVEFLMEALAKSTSPDERRILGQRCRALMSRAEELKERIQQGCQLAAVSLHNKGQPANLTQEAERKPSVEPQAMSLARSSRPLTTREKTILLKSSRVNLLTFPPWEAEPSPIEFFTTELFSDPIGFLALSDTQKGILNAWERVSDMLGLGRATMKSDGSLDLAQDIITDCSVVASMCAATAREEKGHSKIIRNIIYPKSSRGEPEASRNGKYLVKIYFNGCFRKIVIDDYLPTSKSNRVLHAQCRRNPLLVWPALVEKAYLKIMGGYDFPGSNSGTDLLALTGWIPEHVFLRSDDVTPSSIWRRISKGWGFGDVLITLGTGRMTKREEEELGLASEHDYAVIDLKEAHGQRLLLVKNPWSRGAVWTGGVMYAEDSDSNEDIDDSKGGSSGWGEFHAALPPVTAPGVFWIDLDHVCRHFASIYLNWNPALFSFKQDIHFSWDLHGSSTKPKTCFSSHPQFRVENPSPNKSATVWLLLQRHIRTTGLASGGLKSGYISLYVFEKGGSRVYLSEGSLMRGPYVDSPQTLLRIDAFPPNTTYTIVPSSQDLLEEDHYFTLSTFSDSVLKLGSASDIFAYKKVVKGQWLPHTAGGNALSPTYSTNPQFRLSLSKPLLDEGNGGVNATLLLESQDSLSIHVKLVWGGGKRISSVTTRDIVTESGEYRRGCALAEVSDILVPGIYTVVVSTFDVGEVGDFTLTVAATCNVELEIIAAENAGKLTKTILGTWPSASVNRLSWQIQSERLTRISVQAKTTKTISKSPPLLKISVHRRQLPTLRNPYVSREVELIAHSNYGSFSDKPQGVRIGEIDMDKTLNEDKQSKAHSMVQLWEYFVVLERMGGSIGDAFELAILSDWWVSVGDNCSEVPIQ